MAYDGELVKMENGRWARFVRVSTSHGSPYSPSSQILVAIELEERFQKLLSSAEASLDEYRRKGIPVKVRLDEAGDEPSYSFEEPRHSLH